MTLGKFDYNDSYPTCVETYSTLRIFSDDMPPESVTRLIGVEPTKSFRKGDSHTRGRLRRKANGWFYSTEALSKSKDTRCHLDLVLSVLDGKDTAIKALHDAGCKIDITSYYVSTGQGGPWLMPPQMLRLGMLGIGVWWDVYFHGGDRKSFEKDVPA
jgi:hypothetical protein